MRCRKRLVAWTGLILSTLIAAVAADVKKIDALKSLEYRIDTLKMKENILQLLLFQEKWDI